MSLAEAFAGLALRVGSAVGAPFHRGQIITSSGAVMAGGSIVTPGTVARRDCTVQIDAATEAMRSADGYADGDVRFIVLAASFTGGLDTDARVEVLDGPHVGLWLVSALERDPAAVGYVGRGRRG